MAAGEGGVEDEVSEGDAGEDALGVDGEVGRRPERVAADAAVPRDVPQAAEVAEEHRQYRGPDVPRYRAGRHALT
jgi:hypothetical protein